MDAHPLTLKARDLLSRHAAIDVELIETLNAIFDEDVWAAAGCRSMHAYCVEILAMSDDSVARRLKAAELMRRYAAPVRRMIETREIHLTGLALLHRVINDANAKALLNEARGKTKKEIEAIVCRIEPKPQLQPYVRRIATNATAGDVSFTHVARFLLSEAAKAKLDEALDLTPDSDLNDILERALNTYVERTRIKKRYPLKKTDPTSRTGAETVTAPASKDGKPSATPAASSSAEAPVLDLPADMPLTTGPQGYTRDVPADVARAVYLRDNGQCQFNGDHGKCLTTRSPQFHHDDPWAKGGPTTEANLKIFCRSHNLYQARLDFGPEYAKAAGVRC